MDLKSFAEDGFDPKQWINKAWGSNGNQEKEIFVANTVTRLQLYMKQLTNSLDETTTQIVTSIPRIMQEASALQLEGALLQQKLQSLEQKVQSVEEQTGHSIESLQKIDTLKSRLETAASSLREADKWAALASSLEDILDSGVPTQVDKLNELCDQVAAMTASLEMLSDAPDYENKRLQLETLYNRLEAAVSPPLIEALTQMDAERTARYVRLFGGMSRGVSASRCWRRAAAARLARAWRRGSAAHGTHGTHGTHAARAHAEHSSHTHGVPALTALLAHDAPEQVDWLTNVLKSETPLGELVRLYTDLLLSLDPSPTKVASANLKLCSSPEEGILMLTDLRSDIDDFVNCIRGVLEAPRQNKESVLPATLREFGRAAYAPLRELLPKYTEMQTLLLVDNLQDKQLKQEDLLEQSRGILVVAERCEVWLSTASGKAKKIAGDAMYAVFMPAVENFISTLSNLISSHSRRIESTFLAAVTAGQTTGVLSTSFPASLLLESAVSTILDTLAKSQKDEEHISSDPLQDLPMLLLEVEVRSRLASFRNEPVASVAVLRRTKDQLRTLARAVLRNPVDLQLDKIPQLSVWSNNDALSTDLPDFALSPQEYITEIGQYLMTLPQHLEMHLSEKQAPLQFLSEVCTHTCEVYAEKILNIRNMDALGTKRCLNDIVYLSSVVEDLGSTITPALRNLEKSLRAATPGQAAE